MHKPFAVSIQYLKGVGPKRAKAFQKIGIETIEDLLYCFPKRYEDRSHFISISKLEEGAIWTIRARVLTVAEHSSFKRRSFSITRAVVSDSTGSITCVWFNQPYIKQYLKPGQELILFGKVERYGNKLQMSSPEFEQVSGGADDSLHISRMVSLYSLPQGMTQRYFRQLVKLALDDYLPQVQDFLSFDLRRRNNLLNLAKSLLAIHFPDNSEIQKEAFRRLAFEEFFIYQLPIVLRKRLKKNKSGIAHNIEESFANDFLAALPFRLTQAQLRAAAEIKSDMVSVQPMQRLLQGDVASGKTVVAVLACLFAISGGYQAAFMVPTEILARQHYEKISCQLSAFSLQPSAVSSQQKQIKVGLLTSSLSKNEKEKIYRQIKEGKIDLIIGTHALLEAQVEFQKLGLVVIDEQHKFGVGQRALLPKKGPNPDTLIMTATPIPRTLAITLYGDLDISVINELPAGRIAIKTLSFAQKDALKAYKLAKEQLKLGRQAYIIYPVIDESYVLDMAGAEKMYALLKSGEFKGFKLGLIHGRMKEEEQNEAMRKFKEKELDVLVATTVLEVGIDIPNATCMVVEHAERFGLAQLHQLRGRVGRGQNESFCILLQEAETPSSLARIQVMIEHNDGFRIAEEDLKIRGPGEFFGERQHGLTELKIANPLTQMQLLKRAREEAIKVINADPYLETRQNCLLKERLLQRFPEYEKFMVVA